MSTEESDEIENLAYQQRLKAAVHYTVGQICEDIGHDMDVTFNRQFIGVLTESTFKFLQTISTDLELFAKHAKRSTIQPDDVKLLVRKTPSLSAHLAEMSRQQSVANEEKKSKKSKKKTLSVAETN